MGCDNRALFIGCQYNRIFMTAMEYKSNFWSRKVEQNRNLEVAKPTLPLHPTVWFQQC